MRWLVVLALLLSGPASWAATDTHAPWWWTGSAPYYTSVDAACRAIVESPTRAYDDARNYSGSMPNRTVQCFGHTGAAYPAFVNNASETCGGEAGWAQDAVLGCKKTVTTCPSPKTPDANGVCQLPTCPAKGTVIAGSSGSEFTLAGKPNPVDGSVCIDKCSYVADSSASMDGMTYAWGPMTSAGGSCTGLGPAPAAEPASSPPRQPGTCPGTIGDPPITVIVPCSETSTPKPATSASAVTTGTGGASGTSTSSTGTTTCKEGVCTTTTTTTTITTGSNSGTSTSTSTTTESQGEFCAKNAGNAQCSGSGGGGEDPDPCEANGDKLGCLEVGSPPAPAAITQSSVSVAFAPQSGWGADNGSCPAVIHTASIGNVDPYALFCTYAAGIRFIVIGFASIVAVMIFLGRMD